MISTFGLSQTPPTAQFTASPLIVCLEESIHFTNQSTQGSSPITSYQWDFGDGNSSSVQNPNHVYSAPGTYTVTLTVQASNGQADFELKSAYVKVNPKPVPNFTTTANGCSLPVSVTFGNTTTGAVSYNWNFGNSQTSTQQNPAAVNYTTAGTYNVTLIATNSFGCKDTMIKPIVISNFQAGITAPATACQNTPVSITDNSTVGANSWSWSFPGGSPASSTSQNNTVVYSTPGTYTISLSAQNTGLGCSGSTTKQITILPTPVPSFTANPTTGCAPQGVTFTNTSPSGTNFQWNFGDGTTFNGQNPPVHNYSSNGSYTVTLTMTGANGCPGSVSINAVTLTPPVASFTSTDTAGCEPLTVTFSDNSSASIPITNWLWTFGDGTTFVGQNPPPHTYNLGVYDVSLTITTSTGCQGTTTIPAYIEVGKVDLVAFTLDQSPECAKRSVHFHNQSVVLTPHTSTEVTYLWNFGDGGTSTLENPDHSYTQDTGYFDVTLIVTFRGCSDTLTIPDAVYIKAPISRFTPAQTLYCNPASFPVNVAVTDQSIIGKIPDDCSMIWRWGDGSTTTFDDPDFDDANLGSTSHNYTAYGSYTIEQVIYNYTTGCSDSTTQVVHISTTTAGIAGISNDSVCVNNPITLMDNSTSSHPFGTYSWNMGNGATVSGANPTYAYPSFGTFTITLTATNSVGCADDATFSPMTALALPSAQITPDDNAGCAPFLVNFTNGSTLQNNGVNLASFLFTFNDNNTTQTTTSVGTVVSHTYNTEGTFTATLVATDQFGCVSAPASTSITITKPVASFTIDSVICNQENVTTANASSGFAPLSYQWIVDGSQVSTGLDYGHTYNESLNNATSSFTHGYVLIVTDGNGCKDTLSRVLTISTPVAIPQYTFSGAATNANGDYLCPPVFAALTDASLTYGNITNYSWVFGDGKTSVLENPNNTYVFPGTYSLTLTITDEFGCTADTTYANYLTIFGPVANPSWTQNTGGCGQDVNFTIGATSFLETILWTLDDGTTVSDSTSFTHTYHDVTTYNPTLTVTDSNNCEVIYPMNPITIPDIGLNAYFVVNPTAIDLGSLVELDDQSSSVNGISTWTWDMLPNPQVINTSGASVYPSYYTPGSYTITLTVEDPNGCFDTYTTVITVTGDFEMPNIITPNGDGTNEVFSFKKDIFKSFDILIVNRWGNVVHEAKNQTGTTFWDGKTQGGDPCSEGVYFYKLTGILKDNSPIEKSGFVEVVR
ncbi:PKD domain-containing protein [Fluviicola sp.]|uniref:PKD domain-containing protein n=1 Tax=Fluviicola sp. TaxID=1917219 RepID=UPI0031E1985A